MTLNRYSKAAGSLAKHLAASGQAMLLFVVTAFMMTAVLPAQIPVVEGYEDYDPELLEVSFKFQKSRYLVGEPIYWEVEFYNAAAPLASMKFIPSYQDDVYMQIRTPTAPPFRYGGTDPIGMKPTENHVMQRGERRFFHFRVYYDNDEAFSHPSKLLFPEPTEAAMIPAIKYSVNEENQLYAPGVPSFLEIVEPVGRDAECLRLISSPRMVNIIHNMDAEREDFEELENILHLYSDTAYAPHIAVALAMGYYRVAVDVPYPQPVDRRLLQQAIAAFTVLLQVEDIPYIQDLASFMIAVCYYYLDNRAAFVAWYRKYLDNFGELGRFAFPDAHFFPAYEEWKPREYGDLWHLYP